MESFANNLICLISELKAELQKKDSYFPAHQLEKAIYIFSIIRDNISSKSFGDNLSNDLDRIMRWSIDSWPWDNLITKKTWSIIEEYNKIKKTNGWYIHLSREN